MGVNEIIKFIYDKISVLIMLKSLSQSYGLLNKICLIVILLFVVLIGVVSMVSASGVTIRDYGVSSGVYSPGQIIRGYIHFTNNMDTPVDFEGVIKIRAPDGKIYSPSSSPWERVGPGQYFEFDGSKTLQIRVPKDAPEGWYDAKLILRNYHSKYVYWDSGWMENKFRITRGEKPPWLQRDAPTRSTVNVKAGTEVTFSVKIYDYDGDQERVEWYLNGRHVHTSYDVEDHVVGWSHVFYTSGTVKVIGYDKEGHSSEPIEWTINVGSTPRPTPTPTSTPAPHRYDDAKIRSFDPPSGMFNPGDTITASVTIKNTGTTTRSFWVGLSYQKPSGDWYNVPPKKTRILRPEEVQTLQFEYTLPDDAEIGSYNAVAAIWNSYDPVDDKMVKPMFDRRTVYDAFTILTTKRWWESEQGIHVVASLLKEKYHGKAVEIVKNKRYILFAVSTDLVTITITTKNIEGMKKIDIPVNVYKSFLFDKKAEKFLTSSRAKDIAFNLYLQSLLERMKPESTLKAEATFIRNDANSLLSTANNPWITVGGPVMQQMCVGGKILAKLLTTENPEQVLESLIKAEADALIATAEAEGVKVSISSNKNVQETLLILKGLKKSKDVYDGAKTLMETYAFAEEAWKKVSEAENKLEVGREYTSKATKKFISTFMDYVADELFPAGTITKTTLYMEFSGEFAQAAIELANYAEEQWKRDKTWNGYVNSFLALTMAYNELSHAYEFNAMALQENRGRWTGCIAEILHDLTNSVKVKDKIKMAKECAEDRAKLGVKVFINNVGCLYLRASSASSNLLDPHLNFKQSKAEISCHVTPGVYKPGEKVKFTVRIKNYDSGSYRVMLGIKYPDGKLKYLTKTVRIKKGLKEVSFEWTVPRDAKSGRYGVVVSLWSGSKNCGIWLKKNAFSVDSLMGEVEVSYTPGKYTFRDIVRIDVHVKNTGADANFDLHTKIMRGGSVVSSTGRCLFIKSGETETVHIFWHVGESRPGKYSIKVHISSGGKVLDSKLIENAFEVVKINKPPSVLRIKPKRVVKTYPGNVEFKISIKDKDGNLRRVKWYVDGMIIKEENISGTTALSDFKYNFGKGRHYVVAKAYDSKNYSYVSWVVVVTNPEKIRIEFIGDVKVSQGSFPIPPPKGYLPLAVGTLKIRIYGNPEKVEMHFDGKKCEEICKIGACSYVVNEYTLATCPIYKEMVISFPQPAKKSIPPAVKIGKHKITVVATYEGQRVEKSYEFEVYPGNGEVKFIGTVLTDEKYGQFVCYGSYYVKVRIDKILEGSDLIGNLRSAEVCYKNKLNLKRGDRVEVYGYYYGGICPLQCCGRVAACGDSYYIKPIENRYEVIFEDDFNDLSNWIPYGSPSPRILPSVEGRKGVFDNNGDSWCNSGAVSKENLYLADKLPVVIESEVFVKVTNLAGCWDDVAIGLTRKNKLISTGVCAGEDYPWGLILRIHYEGDACWACPQDKRRHAYLYGGFVTENSKWEGFDWIPADNYINRWVKLKIIIKDDRRIEFYVDNKLIYRSKDKICEDILKGKKLYLGIRSSGSAGKAYHDYIRIIATSGLPWYCKYDLNGNGIIDREEVIIAIKDYFKGVIEREKVIELIKMYFRGEKICG